MTESHRKFGELLREGIKRVHILQDKPIGIILDEFGYELRPDDSSKGRFALGHWYYKKRVPASMSDVETLARLIVLNGDLERDWLEQFLRSAGHPNPEKFCSQFFLTAPTAPQPAAHAAAAAASAESPAPPAQETEVHPAAAAPAKVSPRWLGLTGVVAVGILLLIVFWGRLFPDAAELTATPEQTRAAVFAPSTTETIDEIPTASPTITPFLTATEMAPAATATETAVEPTATDQPVISVLDGRCPRPGEPPLFTYDGPGAFADFLNAGGSLVQLVTAVQEQAGQEPDLREAKILAADLTGDGTDEILVNLPTGSGSLWQALGCHENAYAPLWQEELPGHTVLQTVTQLNTNRRADIVRYEQTPGENVSFYEFSILEWDGAQFRELMDPAWFNAIGEMLPAEFERWNLVSPNASAVITDTNGDSVFELVIFGGVESGVATCDTVFQRPYQDTWVWDGRDYQFSDREYIPPLYRFQSNADGDLAFALQQYDRALKSYRETIFEAGLKARSWYPPQLEHCSRIGGAHPATELTGADEAALLEAYARWRILLIQTILGYPDAMQVVYDTLLQTFPEGRTGYAYAAVATAFWEAYQDTQDGQAACSRANEAAAGLTLYPGHDPAQMCVWP